MFSLLSGTLMPLGLLIAMRADRAGYAELALGSECLPRRTGFRPVPWNEPQAGNSPGSRLSLVGAGCRCAASTLPGKPPACRAEEPSDEGDAALSAQ
jgi:hypothetical protein